MENVSTFTLALFAATTALSVYFFWKASRSRTATLLIISWGLVVSVVSLTGFFEETMTLPPRFLLLIGPPVALTLILFVTSRGRQFIDTLDTGALTLLHTVRIPVEIVLHSLSVAAVIPVLMTYEGYNFDILSGITAAIVYFFGYYHKKLNRTILIAWNFLCLGLLVNIVTLAILAAQTPFQQLAFDHPNRAVVYFPIVWLPGIIVPLVLLSHIAALRSLLRSTPAN